MNQYQKEVFRKRVQDFIAYTQNLDGEIRDASAMVNSIRQDISHAPNTRVNDFEVFAEQKLMALKKNAEEFPAIVDTALSMLRGLRNDIPEAAPVKPAAEKVDPAK